MYLQIRLFTILCIVGFLSMSTAFCAEEVNAEAERETAVFTQGQLAVAIMRSLGLEDIMPFDATLMDYATAAQGRGIVPLEGWDINAEVTKEVLAVTVVQALGLRGQVVNLEVAADYIRVLDDRDISIEDVRKVLSNIFVVNVLTDIVGVSAGERRTLSPIVGF